MIKTYIISFRCMPMIPIDSDVLYDRPRIAERILEVPSPVFVDREGTEGVCRAWVDNLFL